LLLAFKKAMLLLDVKKKLIIIGSDRHLKHADIAIVEDINRESERVIFTGYLNQAYVESYFKNADAFILPSWSEGFGLSVLEAFYYKIPLLCSNTTSLPEIAGDAALFFDPFSTDDIANAIENFYANESIGEKLVLKGIERLKSFSWKKASAETVAFYEYCLEKKAAK
jgi:glycosyltransferase involved in cell wall biosynthesis